MDLNNKSVLFISPVYSRSGYGVHARQIALMLDKLAVKYNWDMTFYVTPWGDTALMYGDFQEKNILEKYANKPILQNKKFDISFQLMLPNEWDTRLANFNVGITAAVETDRCNPNWCEACNSMNAVIVPSTFTKSVLLNSGRVVRTPIFVVNESYKEDIFDNVYEDSTQLDFETNFNFLVVSQLTGNIQTDRKNIAFTIKWFAEEFKNDKNVGLIVKTNMGGNSLFDYNATLQNIKSLVAQCRIGEFPRIYLLHGAMTDEQMCSLYKHPKVKAFLTLTHGEGFGLPILEAAACGLPILATNWSGHLDILRPEFGSFVKLDYMLSDIPKERVDNNVFVNGARWAYVQETEAKRKMRKIVEGYTIPKSWAEKMSENIKKKFNSNNNFVEFEQTLNIIFGE